MGKENPRGFLEASGGLTAVRPERSPKEAKRNGLGQSGETARAETARTPEIRGIESNKFHLSDHRARRNRYAELQEEEETTKEMEEEEKKEESTEEVSGEEEAHVRQHTA